MRQDDNSAAGIAHPRHRVRSMLGVPVPMRDGGASRHRRVPPGCVRALPGNPHPHPLQQEQRGGGGRRRLLREPGLRGGDPGLPRALRLRRRVDPLRQRGHRRLRRPDPGAAPGPGRAARWARAAAPTSRSPSGCRPRCATPISRRWRPRSASPTSTTTGSTPAAPSSSPSTCAGARCRCARAPTRCAICGCRPSSTSRPSSTTCPSSRRTRTRAGPGRPGRSGSAIPTTVPGGSRSATSKPTIPRSTCPPTASGDGTTCSCRAPSRTSWGCGRRAAPSARGAARRCSSARGSIAWAIAARRAAPETSTSAPRRCWICGRRSCAGSTTG